MIFVYIPCKDEEEAMNISKILLDKNLIACSNRFPIKSMYWWEGKIEQSNEFVIIAKSILEKFEQIKKEVKRIHSYDVPAIIKYDVSANKDYEGWCRKEVSK